MLKIKFHYYVSDFNGEMFGYEEIRLEDLPGLAEYWNSASCCNVKNWEIV